MVVAAGGTGGHMFPAVATAGELARRGWRVELISDTRGARYLQDRPVDADVSAFRLGSPWRGSPVQRAAAPCQAGWTALRLCLRFLRRRPACVMAFGGYATAPALLAASILAVPRIVHEQNAILGRVNRVFLRTGARLASGVAAPPEAPAGTVPVGIPVRPGVRALRAVPYRPPGPADPVRILVVGGSQGSRAVARLSMEALSALPSSLRARLRVACQVRDEERAGVERGFEAAGIRLEAEPFFADLPRRMAESHLVVARAGASTLAELSAIGRPAILIPLPTAAADHQARNADAYSGAGAARAFDERRGSAAELARTIGALLADENALAAMARAAATALPADAAEALASLAERDARTRAEGRT